MSQEQIAIADMQCWVFRLAQKRWGVSPRECAETFAANSVFGFIAQTYGLIHLSSYDCALDDVEDYLSSRGVDYART